LEVTVPQYHAEHPQRSTRAAQPSGSTVLVAYDATDPSSAALRWALERAGDDGQVVVAHAVEPPSDFYGTPAGDRIIDSQKRTPELLAGSDGTSGVTDLLDALVPAGRQALEDLDQLRWCAGSAGGGRVVAPGAPRAGGEKPLSKLARGVARTARYQRPLRKGHAGNDGVAARSATR
jgi:hypothetical protein